MISQKRSLKAFSHFRFLFQATVLFRHPSFGVLPAFSLWAAVEMVPMAAAGMNESLEET